MYRSLRLGTSRHSGTSALRADAAMVAPFAMNRLAAVASLVFCWCGCVVVVRGQQSAAGQDTLIGVVGRDFVLIGADTAASSGGIAITSSSVDKIAVVHDGGMFLSSGEASDDVECLMREGLSQQAIAVGFAGDIADADRFISMLKTHAQVWEYEAGIGNDVTCVFDGELKRLGLESQIAVASSPSCGLDAEAIANLSRREIAQRMRRSPLQLCLLVGGMCFDPKTGSSSSQRAGTENDMATMSGRVQEQIRSSATSTKSSLEPPETKTQRHIINPFLRPKLFWLDQYGSLQNMPYAAHGHGSNFAYSILDQRYRKDMDRDEALAMMKECFDQLRERYVINSPRPPRIKCVDRLGVSEVEFGTA